MSAPSTKAQLQGKAFLYPPIQVLSWELHQTGSQRATLKVSSASHLSASPPHCLSLGLNTFIEGPQKQEQAVSTCLE